MKLYCGIDLHSNNSYVVLLNEEDKVIYQKRLTVSVRPSTSFEIILFCVTAHAPKGRRPAAPAAGSSSELFLC